MRVAEVRDRIAAAGGGDRTRLIAVTKAFGPEAPRAALAAGVTDLGENYAQELESKSSVIAADIAAGIVTAEPRWHFIGGLQSNKIARLAPTVALWQTIDRLSLGRKLAARVPGAEVLVQVNVSEEEQKGGVSPLEARQLVDDLRALDLDVRGLMTIGAQGPPETVRPGFRLLTQLADDLGLDERSMGMTDDLEIAVEEGSTMVRIGRALFGARPPR